MEFDGAGGKGELEVGMVAGLADDEVGDGGVTHELHAIAVGSAEGKADPLGAIAELKETSHRLATGEPLFESGTDDADGLLQLGTLVVVEQAHLHGQKGEAVIGSEAPDGVVDQLGVGDGQNLAGESFEADAAQPALPDEAVVFFKGDPVPGAENVVGQNFKITKDIGEGVLGGEGEGAAQKSGRGDQAEDANTEVVEDDDGRDEEDHAPDDPGDDLVDLVVGGEVLREEAFADDAYQQIRRADGSPDHDDDDEEPVQVFLHGPKPGGELGEHVQAAIQRGVENGGPDRPAHDEEPFGHSPGVMGA